MSKSIIIGGGIISFLILATGVYFFARVNSDDLLAQRTKIQEDLALAKEKLTGEKETLKTITSALEDAFPLGASVQDEIRRTSAIVAETDFMFTDASGANPKLIVKNPLPNIDINNQRRNINILIGEWQKKMDLNSITTIDKNESEKIKQEVGEIKNFLEDLSKIAGALTPTNSGLSQFEIITQSSQIPIPEAIDEVLASSLTSPIQISTPPPNIEPKKVIMQTQAVAQAETEIATIQKQLTQIEEQIQQMSPISPIPPVENNYPNSNPENQAINPTSNQNNIENTNYTYPPPREIIPNEGIIPQPGPPRLIQGTDAY